MRSPPPEGNHEFGALLQYLKNARGFDFTGYKPATLQRRIAKRMREVGAQTAGDYVDYLEVHPEEFPRLFNTILINVTAFFRDPEAWDYLASEAIPSIIAAKPPGEPIRIWSAGCASGEEAYTLAMVLAEALGPEAFDRRVKIYATDLDEQALSEARQATYTSEQIKPVPAEFRDKYLSPANGGFAVTTSLRRNVIFGRHDLVQDAPISRLDLLVCRNTLMYLNAETQARVVARLHFAVRDQGLIFLGKAEMLLTHGDLFTPLTSRYRVFVKVPRGNGNERALAMGAAGTPEATRHRSSHVTLGELAGESGPVAQIVVDRDGNLALANAAVRDLLGLGPKDLGRPLKDLEICYHPAALQPLIDRADAEGRTLTIANVEQRFASGPSRYLTVMVSPLRDKRGSARGAVIAFVDTTHESQLQAVLQRTTQDLETAYEELQSANEELETSNEELQSTVEELETTNEELQSTNEELETMNEELESTNEEYQTINAEIHQRTEALNKANAFLESVFSGLTMGVVVVDHQFGIQEWNHRAEDLWGLRSDEIMGQSLLNLDIGLPVEELREPLRRCLAGDAGDNQVVLSATNRRGRPSAG